MSASIRIIPTALRGCLLPIVILLYISNAGRPAYAAPETPAEASKHYAEAKFRSWSRAVLEFRLQATETLVYRGTGVLVEMPDGSLRIITADHVIADGVGKLREKLTLRSYNADPDDASEWHGIGEFASTITRIHGSDLAFFTLKASPPGMTPLKIAEHPAAVGDDVIGFGYATASGHMLVGKITGSNENGGTFLAVKLGAAHGDSGGPLVNLHGKLVGIVSSDASPQMTNHFVREETLLGAACRWNKDDVRMGADTLIVSVPAVVAH